MESAHAYFTISKYKLKTPVGAGVTLIELLVVFAIITVITGVVITSQSTFNDTIILSNTAHDIALAVHSARGYGLGSMAVGAVRNTGYGLHFNSVARDSFVFFADTYPGASSNRPDSKSGDRAFTVNSDINIQTYTLGNAITIRDFCAHSSGRWLCSVSQGGGLASLDVVFVRPNPNPFISLNGRYVSDVSVACLTIASPHGGEEYVSINVAGQINANASSCP